MDKPHSLLIVDDDEAIRHNLRLLLVDQGFRVLEAANGREALAVVEQERLALVLTDLRMPEMDGLSLIAALVQEHPELPLIIISGVGIVHEAIEAVRLGAWDYLSKPLHDQDAVLLVIERALERARLMAENRRYRENLEELVQERTAQLETANRELEEEIAERKQAEKELHEREQQFRTLAENLPDNIARYDRNCRKVFVNPQLEKTLGRSTDSLIGLTPLEGHGEIFRAYQHILEQVLASGQDAELDQTVADAEKGMRHHNIRFVAERDADGTIIGAMVIGRDITDRKRIETELLESRQMLEEAQRIAHVGSWELDLASNTLEWSDEIFRIFEIDQQQFGATYEAFVNIIHPADREMVDRAYTVSVASRIPYDIEHRLLLPDGRIKYVYERCETDYGDDGRPLRSLGTVQDITERKQAEKRLRAKQEQLAAMTVELSLAEERERRRIAAVLHDQIGQTLLLGRIKLGALEDVTMQPTVLSAVDQVKQLIDQTIHDTRSLTMQLHPPMLSEAGLEAALRWLARQMSNDYGLQVEIDDDQQPKPLGDEMRSILYQAVRELLINVAKHAATVTARLVVQRKNDMLQIAVSDQGKGFATTGNDSLMPMEGGFGLFSASRRIIHLGGEFTIESAPGAGTRITILAPLAETA